MSYIFDALQRSEAESSGEKRNSGITAAELLKHAERRALQQWGAETNSVETADRPFTDADLQAISQAMQPRNGEKDASGPSKAESYSDGTTPFELFPTIEAYPVSKDHLVCLTDKGSPAAEAFRLLRVRLRHLRKDKPLKKVLITSSVPQEGKSFSAANLACALASGSHEKVLLLEGDLRRPTQSRLFGIRPESGICECVRGKRSLTSSIYSLNGAGVWLLPAGSAEGSPLEIIQSPKLPSLMAQLSEWFDWIIIDSPPMLPLADTTALARLADGILLVTRRDITEKRKLEKGIAAFESDKLIGAILNSSNSSRDKDYYYYRPESTDQPNVISD